MSVKFYRNSRKAFLLGASWDHDRSWTTRLIHFYLGPWLFTLSIKKDV